jgi:hypothetical protein
MDFVTTETRGGIEYTNIARGPDRIPIMSVPTEWLRDSMMRNSLATSMRIAGESFFRVHLREYRRRAEAEGRGQAK